MSTKDWEYLTWLETTGFTDYEQLRFSQLATVTPRVYPADPAARYRAMMADSQRPLWRSKLPSFDDVMMKVIRLGLYACLIGVGIAVLQAFYYINVR